MKKNRSFLVRMVVLLALGTALAACSKAEAQTERDFKYKLLDDGSGIHIEKYIGTKGGKITIPAKIEGYPVEVIGKNAFAEMTDSDIKIYNSQVAGTILSQQSADSIGAGERKQRITSVEIPNTVYLIWDGAFSGCQALTQVKLQANPAEYGLTIGVDAFWKTGLKSVTIPDNTKAIGNRAFANCPNLSSVTIGKRNAYTAIGEAAFSNCPELATVKFLGAVKYGILGETPKLQSDNDAFRNCPRLSIAQRKTITDSGYEGRFDNWY
jgi:hypothetical protein